MDHKLSVSSPLRSGTHLESLAAEEAPQVRPGSAGTATLAQSRSARAYLVTKDRPLERRPSSRGLSLETVIGTDERKRILDTDHAPWRMICALRIRGSTGALMLGTGWLAGPQTVLTAGHCVNHDDLGGDKWATEIELAPGRNGDEFPFQTFKANRFSAHATWIAERSPDFDMGCIHLDEPIGDQLGWFGIGALSADQLQGVSVNVSGYPGDRGNGTEQYFHANRVLKVTDRRVYYDVDTFGGQSGSPVWVQPQLEEPPVVVGIHAYGVMGGIEANSAPRIDNDVFGLIAHWIEHGAGTPVA